MFYRFSQLYNAIFPKIELKEYLCIEKILAAKELILFYKQTLPDQRHALDVAKDIQKERHSLENTYGSKAYQVLLRAALLHDCGKSLLPPRLWQRIFIVVTGYLPITGLNYILSKQNIFVKTILVYKLHPAWGKHLAARAGCNQEILSLIQNHHAPTNSIEKVLAKADSRH